eukprot:2257088-Amphidinium_carterae.1
MAPTTAAERCSSHALDSSLYLASIHSQAMNSMNAIESTSMYSWADAATLEQVSGPSEINHPSDCPG